MKPLRLGFCGFRHDHIVALYNLARERAGVEIAGVFEEHPEGLARAARNGIGIRYDSYEALLADPGVDAVAIGDYYGIRGDRTLRALAAGKHVISDKPLCTAPEELAAIRTLAKEKNLAVCLMLDLRDHPNVCAALAAVKGGAIGRINNIRFNGMHPLLSGVRPGWYFEEGKHGGVINDLAIHGIDLVRAFTGAEIKAVLSARCWNFYADRAPWFADSAQFMLELDSGAGVIADVSYAAPDSFGFDLPNYWEFEFWGEKGLMRFSVHSNGAEAFINGENAARRYPPVPCKKDYLDRFLENVRRGTDHSGADLQSSSETLRIQQAADGRSKK